MEVVPQASGGWAKAAPIACGCGLVAAAAYLATNDPAAPGGAFPGCPFHALTGLWCPGCGLTRGAHALLRGDVPGAVGFNVFTPLVLVGFVAGVVAWVRHAWGRPLRHAGRRIPMWVAPAGVAIVVGYGVLRNLPGLRALAP